MSDKPDDDKIIPFSRLERVWLIDPNHPEGGYATTRVRDLAEDALLRSHEAEAVRVGAEFYNFGWGQDEHCICSKTTHGKLSSWIDPTTMQVSHEWR
jgi:hypothetical protein